MPNLQNCLIFHIGLFTFLLPYCMWAHIWPLGLAPLFPVLFLLPSSTLHAHHFYLYSLFLHLLNLTQASEEPMPAPAPPTVEVKLNKHLSENVDEGQPETLPQEISSFYPAKSLLAFTSSIFSILLWI